MDNSMKNYRLAQRLFYRLLDKGELKEKDDKELYLSYLNEEEMKNIVDVIAEEFKSDVILIRDTIYLVPHEDNDVIGFDYREEGLLMKNREHAYLTYLVITVIFAEFTNDVSPASYLSLLDIITLVTETLDRASNKSNIEDEEMNADFNVLKCNELWKSKGTWREDGNGGRDTTSVDYKIGFIRRVATFLKQRGLVRIIVDEEKIVPSNKFKELMFGYFLNDERKNIVENLLGIREEFENAEN